MSLASGYAAFNLDIGGQTVAIAADGSGSAGSLATAVATAITAAGITGLSAAVNAGKVELTNTAATPVDVKMGATSIGGATAQTTPTAPSTSGFAAIATGGLTINGQSITVGAATTASQRTNDLMKAINENATLKAAGVTASLKDGELSIKSASANLVIGGTAADVGTGLTAATTNFTAGSIQNGYKDVDVSSIEGADNAIKAMDAALRDVNSARADLGAIQNRFESVVANLSVNSENLSASKSRIMDADFASETANLSRSQILQQAGTAMVAQANQLPQGVLSLLR